MKTYRIRLLLLICHSILWAGCGGGTYGTGGSNHVLARVVDGSGVPVEGVVATGVAIESVSVSDKRGVLTLPLNDSFPEAPVKFAPPGGREVIRYVPSNYSDSREELLEIVVPVGNSGSAPSGAQGEPSCPELLDSWRSALADPELGLSQGMREKLETILGESQLSCEVVLNQLEGEVFG